MKATIKIITSILYIWKIPHSICYFFHRLTKVAYCMKSIYTSVNVLYLIVSSSRSSYSHTVPLKPETPQTQEDNRMKNYVVILNFSEIRILPVQPDPKTKISAKLINLLLKHGFGLNAPSVQNLDQNVNITTTVMSYSSFRIKFSHLLCAVYRNHKSVKTKNSFQDLFSIRLTGKVLHIHVKATAHCTSKIV